MAQLPEVDEFYTWHLDVCQKMTPLLLESMDIAKSKVAKGKPTEWVLDDWLKEQNPELIAEWNVVRSVVNLLSDSVIDPKDVEIVMDYFIETTNKKKKVPHVITTLFAHNFKQYKQAQKDGKPITLDQAFGLEKKKGMPKRSNRLNVDVIGITRELIGKELELTLAIESYQETQNEKDIDTETSTETLRTMFHEQKEQALIHVVLRSQLKNGNFIPSDKVKDLVGKYWTAEQDPLKIGTSRKKS